MICVCVCVYTFAESCYSKHGHLSLPLKDLPCMPFEGGRLFGEALDKFIMNVTGGQVVPQYILCARGWWALTKDCLLSERLSEVTQA